MPTTTVTSHIWLDDQGRAWIDDTKVKVLEVALDHVAYGWSAEEMHSQHPHLALSQIYAALSYYYDHQTEFDRLIEQGRRQAEALAGQSADSPVRRRIRAAGKL